eukprot:1031955-Prorocentrum_minimum.AAC.1
MNPKLRAFVGVTDFSHIWSSFSKAHVIPETHCTTVSPCRDSRLRHYPTSQQRTTRGGHGYIKRLLREKIGEDLNSPVVKGHFKGLTTASSPTFRRALRTSAGSWKAPSSMAFSTASS